METGTNIQGIIFLKLRSRLFPVFAAWLYSAPRT